MIIMRTIFILDSLNEALATHFYSAVDVCCINIISVVVYIACISFFQYNAHIN
jgi:hypothetical protein